MTALGYVVITSEDLDAWGSFAESVLGLQISTRAGAERETLYLRMDDRRWRIGIEHGTDGGLAALGFEVVDRAAFERLKVRLADAGVTIKDAPEVAADRQVIELFQAEDPSGHPLEFFYGARIETTNFFSPQSAGFVTGEQGFGHAVIGVADVEQTYAFYVGLLGFRVSDVASVGPTTLYFTSPNSRHHSIGFGSLGPETPVVLQHIMVEVDDIDSLGRALDRVYDNGAPLVAGLGRHSNDHMISFYCVSPSGLMIEYGWGARDRRRRPHDGLLRIRGHLGPSFA